MSLSDSQLERYARQVIIPGLGADGQERLLGCRVLVLGQEHECEIAREYLARAGLAIATSADESIDCVVVCEIDTLTDAELARLGAKSTALVWYSLSDRQLTAGTLPQFDGRRPVYSTIAAEPSYELALGALAACDAAASTVALLLGWDSKATRRENRFA